MYGSPTTKDLKKPHSSRRVGGAEKQRGVHWFLKRNFAGKKGLARSIKVMKRKDLQPGLFYPAKLSFRMEGQIKCFPDNVKSKEFSIAKPSLYEMLKGFI